MNPNHQQRIARAIADCDRYIALESPRATDLRPPKTQQLLDFYLEHRARLQAQLEVV